MKPKPDVLPERLLQEAVVPRKMAGRDEYRKPVEDFKSLPIDHVIHIDAVPADRKYRFVRILEDVRDQVAAFVLEPSSGEAFSKDTMQAAEKLKELLRGARIEEMRAGVAKRRPVLPATHRYEMHEQQHVYDSMNLFLQFIVFRAVLDTFQSDAQDAVGQKSYSEVLLQWNRGLVLFEKYVMPTLFDPSSDLATDIP